MVFIMRGSGMHGCGCSGERFAGGCCGCCCGGARFLATSSSCRRCCNSSCTSNRCSCSGVLRPPVALNSTASRMPFSAASCAGRHGARASVIVGRGFGPIRPSSSSSLSTVSSPVAVGRTSWTVATGMRPVGASIAAGCSSILSAAAISLRICAHKFVSAKNRLRKQKRRHLP